MITAVFKQLKKMSSILAFTHDAYGTFCTQHYVGDTGYHMVHIYQNHKSASILLKMMSIYCLTSRQIITGIFKF